MGERDPHHQVHWAGGIILGAVVIGLLGLSVSEKAVHEWQELIAGVLGAGVTLFGAELIVRQIRADDDREIRREKRAALSLAQSLVGELEAHLEVLSDRQHLLQTYGRILAKSKPPFHIELAKLSPKDAFEYTQSIARLEKFKVDYSRLSNFRDSIGMLGGATAREFSRFIADAVKLRLEGGPRPESWGFEAGEIELRGHVGERLLSMLNLIIKGGGDTSLVDEADYIQLFNSAIDQWQARIKTREEFWRLPVLFISDN